MAKRNGRKAWHSGCRWVVEVETASGWVAIYQEATKQEAAKLAAKWSDEHGAKTRVVPGPGHKSRRNASDLCRCGHAKHAGQCAGVRVDGTHEGCWCDTFAG